MKQRNGLGGFALDLRDIWATLARSRLPCLIALTVSFFVPAGGNYQYSAGPEGVEVMEFRTAAEFNMRLSGNTEADWKRIMENAMRNYQGWLSASPPPAAARMME